jgi:hypothetical protein
MSDINLLTLAVETYHRLLPELQRTSKPIAGGMKRLKSAYDLPSINQVLSTMPDLPPGTVLLGQCTDGLPFLFDLRHPDGGPILVSGDQGSGKLRQLQVLVQSAIQLHAPHELQIAVITPTPEDWESFLLAPGQVRHTLAVQAWYERQAVELVKDLVRLVEDRRTGRRLNAHVLLILDDLTALQDWDYEAQVAFHWLLEYGAQSSVWPIASIESSLAKDMRYWVDIFRTRLIGRINDPEQAAYLSMYGGNLAGKLTTDVEFSAWLGQEWMAYQVPVAEGFLKGD